MIRLLAVVLGAAIWVALFWAITAAWAHHAPSGWEYPSACCDNQDCRTMHTGEVEVRPDGYWLPAFERLIPFEEANTSPDGEFHVCGWDDWLGKSFVRRTETTDHRLNRSGTCFFAPEGAV